jgi:uridylate kinase
MSKNFNNIKTTKGHKRTNSNSQNNAIEISSQQNMTLNQNSMNKAGMNETGMNSLIQANSLSGEKDDFKALVNKVECVGKVPTARFGHTITLISPVKVVLFGGAVGDTRNFQFTGDTYVLNIMTKIWLKLESIYYLTLS